MLPAPLAPLDPHKTRALTTIYAPRKLKTRARAATMLDNEIPIKPNLSPFHPLPAIGQKLEKTKTKVFVFDLNKADSNLSSRTVKLNDVLKPLTPLTYRIHGHTRNNSSERLDPKKPQQLVRENTYDVIDPVYVNGAAKVKTEEFVKMEGGAVETARKEEQKVSPKTRFKKAAMQVAKLSSMPETGKLLCLRERETFVFPNNQDGCDCRLQELPRSPAEKFNKISEIFQCLDMKGRHRDRMKKENSWF